MSRKSESWRERYVRILSSPKAITDSQDDLQAMEDLIEEGFLRGEAVKEQGIRVAAVAGLLIPTLAGNIFAEEQKAILSSQTFLGRLKSQWVLFGSVVGTIVGWSLGLLTPLVQQRLYPSIQQHQDANNSPNLAPNTSTHTEHSTPEPATAHPIPAKP